MHSSTINSWLVVVTLPNGVKTTAIDQLFRKLDGMYQGKWRSAFNSPEAVNNWREAWAEGLFSRGIKPERATRGLNNCMDMYEWPPSLPQFIKACETPSRDEQAPDNFLMLKNEAKPKSIRAFKGQISELLKQMKMKNIEAKREVI